MERRSCGSRGFPTPRWSWSEPRKVLSSAGNQELTTWGRRTGAPRAVKLSFALDDDRLLLLAHARHGTQWCRNLRTDPRAVVRVAGWELSAETEFPKDQEASKAHAPELFTEKYGRAYGDQWYRGTERVAVALTVLPPGEGGRGRRVPEESVQTRRRLSVDPRHLGRMP